MYCGFNLNFLSLCGARRGAPVVRENANRLARWSVLSDEEARKKPKANLQLARKLAVRFRSYTFGLPLSGRRRDREREEESDEVHDSGAAEFKVVRRVRRDRAKAIKFTQTKAPTSSKV